MIALRVNGEERTAKVDCTVADLLHELGRDPKKLAVEVNGEVVPRAEQASTVLKPGDVVEIVTLVGGG